jgi:hypothetical protein
MTAPSRFPKTQPIISGRLLRRLKRAERGEAGYRALSGLAVWCLILGLLSSLTFLDWSLAAVPLATILLGWIALRRIRRNPSEIGGAGIVRCGIGLAVGFWIIGYGWLSYQLRHGVPPGYRPISFADLQPAADDIEQRVPEAAVNLDRVDVFIRGYMVAGKQRTGLREFVLTQDQGQCPFCNPMPKPTQLIKVKLKPPLTAEYTSRAIGVGGKFTAVDDPRDPKRAELGGLVYEIEADYLR